MRKYSEAVSILYIIMRKQSDIDQFILSEEVVVMAKN